MPRALFICLALCALVQPARAQTRIYVSGDVFADITRFSRATTPDLAGLGLDDGPRDGVTFGGGGRIGAFFAPSWSLEFGVDFGKRFNDERTLDVRVPIRPLVPSSSLQFQSRTGYRFTASSVLIGYHPFVRGRVQPGFRGGVSFMHSERTFTYTSFGTSVIFVPTLPGVVPALPTPYVVTDQYTAVSNGLTATLGGRGGHRFVRSVRRRARSARARRRPRRHPHSPRRRRALSLVTRLRRGRRCGRACVHEATSRGRARRAPASCRSSSPRTGR